MALGVLSEDGATSLMELRECQSLSLGQIKVCQQQKTKEKEDSPSSDKLTISPEEGGPSSISCER